MPWFCDLVQLSTEIPLSTTIVNNTSQAVPQASFSQQPTKSETLCLVSRSGQLQEQCFSVEVTEKIAIPERSSTSKK